MIVVTGAAGFIGSCVVAQLNERGQEDLVLVDHLECTKDGCPHRRSLPESCEDPKTKNLANKKFAAYCDKADFLDMILKDQLPWDVSAIIHMGACSSTTLQDAEYFQKNNFEYTRHLAQWALDHKVRFIYASSAATYGDGSCGYKDDVETIRRCRPLNLYGESKQKLDEWILDQNLLGQVVGLKFFNVFGPNEYHKKDMRSVIAKAYDGVVAEGKMRLFKSYKPEYGDGEQKRDFIYVKDAVDVVLFFLDHPEKNGIFNVGTGQARTWNDLAQALFKATDQAPCIEYFEMPEVLKQRYQYFTQADMAQLKEAGYTRSFTSLEEAISDYANFLSKKSYL